MHQFTATYRPDHARGVLDVAHPDGPGPFPVVVVIHGGGWREGDKAEAQHHVRFLVPLGYACVMPNYRLTGAHPHPAQLDDILASLDWVGANAHTFGGDPQRVALLGWSAGGHLTALAALMATQTARSASYRIKCAHPVCGVFDVPRWLSDCPQYRPEVAALIANPPEAHPDVMRAASPIHQLRAGAPPFRLTHGDADRVVPCNQSLLFRDALQTAGIPVECVIAPGEGHSSLSSTRPTEPLGGLPGLAAFLTLHLSP